MTGALTRGQRDAIEQVREVERASAGALEVLDVADAPTEHGWLRIEVSVSCQHFERSEGGLPLRDRERFIILVPPDFPFAVPAVWTPRPRFAGFEHVQWGYSLCLYQSTETEWDASDGMFGFLARLNYWLTQGARNEFEPAGIPLHPPVAYPSESAGIVISRVNTPAVESTPWIGFAGIDVRSSTRVDIIGWRDNPKAARDAPSASVDAGVAVLLPEAMPFEYPEKLSQLVDRLAERGVPLRLLLLLLIGAALANPADTPLYVVLGTPSRGHSGASDRRQHLVVWKLAPLIADALRLAANQFSENERMREMGDEMERVIVAWASQASLEWCSVYDVRPEVTVRRDASTPISQFGGRTVALWGAGALGAPVAELLVRAGVRRLVIRDRGIVTPGILVRQPYLEVDIGRPKVEALVERLRQIDPRVEIVPFTDDLLIHPLGDADWADGAEIVIDASASARVLEKLELRRQEAGGPRAPIIAMAVDYRAEHGLVAIASGAHTGGPADVMRRAKLEACRRSELTHFADAFWPRDRHPVFQPEPGCSANTFIGSAADLTGFAAAMLNAAARDLSGGMLNANSSRSATALLLSQSLDARERAVSAHFVWPADLVSRDPHADYEIRIASGAWREIEGWIAAGRRLSGEDVETGGIVFGERNDASRVIWVDEVIGPPPDSWAAPEGFICGTEGVARANAEKTKRARGSVAFVGMWHTHPESDPLPSSTDIAGMAQITSAADSQTPKALLVIVGCSADRSPTLGTYLFTRRDFQDSGLAALPIPPAALRGVRRGRYEFLRHNRDARRQALQTGRITVYRRACEIRQAHVVPPAKRIGLALSGGGSRAIAFHLGCLRALRDRGVLDQIRTLSTVSGGSVIGAMYAYGDYEDFAAFDADVVNLLRSGLAGPLARRAFSPVSLAASLGTTGTAGITALATDLARSGAKIARAIPLLRDRLDPGAIQRIQPPLRRWRSRTTAFGDTLRDQPFGTRSLRDVKQRDLEVIINATELRTGTAFRFGSRLSGSSRFGELVDNGLDVACAVAASAAYPVFLPALDREFEFVDNHGTSRRRRVLLTDGGVYDNLGTTCLEPGRDPAISKHSVEPEFIIACDAGVGVADGFQIPYWWPTRMIGVFELLLRRVQNSTRNRLHQLAATGQLQGFVLPYLGQADDRLPWAPADLIARATVVDYPTDFSPMRDEDIERLATRGEQLTRLLIAHYLPLV
jgi:integrative and conjugative element protein (TIGR02256 family)